MNILTLKDYQELYNSLVLSSIALEEKIIRLETEPNDWLYTKGTLERYTEALESIERLIDKIEPYID